MKAILYKGPGNFDYEEVETPSCPKNGVLIKVISVGLCGSDIRTFNSGHHKVKPPFIIGHEIAGIVEESDSEYYKKGQKVMLNPGITCGKCKFCTSDKNLGNQCKNIVVPGMDFYGGYAQYVALPEVGTNPKFLHILPDDFNLDLAPLSETLASVYSTHDFINITKGDIVLIIGAGPLGNLHSAMAKIRGAKKVILSEVNQPRLDKAKRFDFIDLFVNPTTENLEEIVNRETDGDGVDVAITACPVGAVQEEATHYVRPRGKVLLFGGLPHDNCHVSFDSNLIHYKELQICGGYSFSPDSFKHALDLIVDGTIPADKFVTHTLPLSEIKRGIEMTRTGEAIKVILKPWE